MSSQPVRAAGHHPRGRRISLRTGKGSGAAPSSLARRPWAISSLRICSTIARLRASSFGRRSRWPSRWPSTCRSVSSTKPRLARSPARPASDADGERARVPERIEKAARGHRARRAAAASRRDGRSLPGRPRSARRAPGIAGRKRLPVVERLRGDFTGVIHPHQSGGLAPLGLGQFVAVAPPGRARRGAGRGENGPKRAVGGSEQSIEGVVLSRGLRHTLDYIRPGPFGGRLPQCDQPPGRA